jgi:superfamily II DNA or RNA helicase/HKD family nuclease
LARYEGPDRLSGLAEEPLKPGLHEALLTRRLEELLGHIVDGPLAAELSDLRDAEASDRVSRHIAAIAARAIDRASEGQRSDEALRVAAAVTESLQSLAGTKHDLTADELADPARVLVALLQRLPDGRAQQLERPLTPLLDTTVFTNAPGEPAVGHELRAEVPSADAIELVMAFIRWSGVRPLIDVLRRHCAAGKTLRILTTTYTNSTEQRALDELEKLGAEVRVSYDTSSTRLHAKAWLFHRESGYSTAYIGSSNLSHSAQLLGLEWNVRVSAVRNPDAVAKMAAVFTSYWEGRDFVPYECEEFARLTQVRPASDQTLLSPIEIELRPFQEALLEQIELARHQGHHRNLLVAATGTGKTVMAAVDYARLRSTLGRSRVLLVAHRAEILDQSRATFRHAMRDAAFGEKWVGGERPTQFEHVFASIQSLNVSDVRNIDPSHFDVVIVDEFHHAAAPSYTALLEHLKPVELLGLTATPERADGLDVLGHFDGRIAAELRLWDAIDQQYLAPFAYFGIHDGVDLRGVPWRRGQGYDSGALENVLTADDAWVHLVVQEIQRKVSDPASMRALGFCVSVGHAQFMAKRFSELNLPAVSLSAASRPEERGAALRDLADGTVCAVFTVDLFNEGIDIPAVDTLLLLRPTDSPTLFLQQLGRGLRRASSKTVCTVLDFVGTHRKEFRFDRRFRALLGGSRADVERQIQHDFPFLPAGCSLHLDAVAKDIIFRSIRESIPSTWRERCAELRSLGAVRLGEYLESTGLELDDIYASGHSWSEMRREAGLSVAQAGPEEGAMLRAAGRLLHVDDDERLDAYPRLLAGKAPVLDALPPREQRLLRMLVASLTTLSGSASIEDAIAQLWDHPQVRAELVEVLELLGESVPYLDHPLGLAAVPLALHSRYTRAEILSAVGVGDGAKPPTWQTGVWWEPKTKTDLFAFTLDKSVGGFSPTTRYRDYAISPELIHWESQSATAADSPTGQRYINQREAETNVLLFARLRTTDRAFWCLGPASYVSHEGDRPIAFVWKLRQRLPAELYTSFAAAVA